MTTHNPEENTPDTEERERMNRVHNQGICKCCDNLMALLTSRDTYWKERVEKEVEGMKQSETHEDHCDGYCNESACYLPDRRTSNRTLDKLLDNLK